MAAWQRIRDPLRTARAMSRRLARWQLGRREDVRTRRLPRIRREACWCGGALRAFRWHPSYGVCVVCGTYVNQCPVAPEALGDLYSFAAYWHDRQASKGHPPIELRPGQDRGDGRVDYWLGLIERYGGSGRRVLEIGCAHGTLLMALRDRGYTCAGVEPDEATAAWVRGTTGLDVRAGLFPALDLPPCDLFLAFDVIEHSPDPEEFLRQAARLLSPGGVAIIQTPIDRYSYEPPFGDRFDAAFDDVEHLFLFTNAAWEELARRTGLTIVSQDDRLWLHHEVCVLQKPAQSDR